jgi:hypothetical protein
VSCLEELKLFQVPKLGCLCTSEREDAHTLCVVSALVDNRGLEQATRGSDDALALLITVKTNTPSFLT